MHRRSEPLQDTQLPTILRRHFALNGINGYYPRIKIFKTTKGIILTQSHYIATILTRYIAYNDPNIKNPINLYNLGRITMNLSLN